MSNNNAAPPQSTLLLRLLAGGYLVYLAWDVRSAMADGPLFVLAVAVFAIVGLLLAGHSLWVLIRHDYFRKTPDTTESTEDWEDESNE